MTTKFSYLRLSQGEHRGYTWQTRHNGMGFRCGYIRLMPTHPWYGKPFEYFSSVSVHGDVTFSEMDTKCHFHSSPHWWIGFDCAHRDEGDDPDPILLHTMPNNELKDLLLERGEYAHWKQWLKERCPGIERQIRTQAFAEAQCLLLCEQAENALHVE